MNDPRGADIPSGKREEQGVTGTISFFQDDPVNWPDVGSYSLGPLGPPTLTMYEAAGANPLFEVHFPDGYDTSTCEFRVAPMADPIIHFEHGVWYRIEVVDGQPTIRPLPPADG